MLNKRRKWTSREAALEVDDFVWLLEQFNSRGIWPLGRVTQTFAGLDNTTRSCEVKTALGKIIRSAFKLMHVYPKPTARLGLGFVGPEDVNAEEILLTFIVLYRFFLSVDWFPKFVTRKVIMLMMKC